MGLQALKLFLEWIVLPWIADIVEAKGGVDIAIRLRIEIASGESHGAFLFVDRLLLIHQCHFFVFGGVEPFDGRSDEIVASILFGQIEPQFPLIDGIGGGIEGFIDRSFCLDELGVFAFEFFFRRERKRWREHVGARHLWRKRHRRLHDGGLWGLCDGFE